MWLGMRARLLVGKESFVHAVRLGGIGFQKQVGGLVYFQLGGTMGTDEREGLEPPSVSSHLRGVVRLHSAYHKVLFPFAQPLILPA